MKPTAATYFDELETRLALLSEEKRKEVLREYQSHLDSARAEGISEREFLRSLKSPRRLSDSILQAHGVFAHAEKWQVRWLAVYCIVVALLIAYALKFSVGSVRLQALPLYAVIATLWGVGCLPYYVACLKSRRFLWKPFAAASLLIVAIIWGNFAFRANIVHQRIASSYVAAELVKTKPSDLKEFGEAVLKLSSYGSGSGMGHFGWLYEDLQPILNRGSHLVVSDSASGRFLVPDSSPDNDQPVKFGFISDPTLAQNLWEGNKDRLNRFAWNARIISKMKEMNQYPVPLFHIKYLPGMIRYASYIVLPLGLFAILFSSYRPLVRRPRGLA